MAVAIHRRPEYFPDEIADVLLDLRSDLGLTAQEAADKAVALAKEAGELISLNERTVRDWEKRRPLGHKPRMGPRIRWYVKALGTTVEALRDAGREP
jgi:hypothetical protein